VFLAVCAGQGGWEPNQVGMTWNRRSTVFRNGALRSMAPGSWPGRPRRRGHALSDLKRPVECVDGERGTRPRQCRSRRQGIRGGYSAYDRAYPLGKRRDRRRGSLRDDAPRGCRVPGDGGTGMPVMRVWTAVRFRWLRGPATTCKQTSHWRSGSRLRSESLDWGRKLPRQVDTSKVDCAGVQGFALDLWPRPSLEFAFLVTN